ncbi:MAG: HD domain-containing protein [Methanoregula sp.]|uniref:HD domain-containing protein n=1 Tax=Methanoregula sp. TaxID=2052170 RepID=UPI003BB1D81D
MVAQAYFHEPINLTHFQNQYRKIYSFRKYIQKRGVLLDWNEVRDPIHGFIEFTDFEKSIISHPIFQRLRRIKQLALTEMVYPAATHTRFEHSLGVMHVADAMFNTIRSYEENNNILRDKFQYEDIGLERELFVIRLAALLHDIGHSPFSHSGEDLFPIKSGNKRYTHEDYTVALIKGPLREKIEGNPHNKANLRISSDEIAQVLERDPTAGASKLFWGSIISSQLDADRADYLLRDSYHIGVKYGIYDLARILGTISIGTHPETDDPVIGINEDGWQNAEAMILARYQIYSQVIFHDVRRSYDIMLHRALKSIINEYPPPSEINEFVKYDDYSVWVNILTSNNYWCKSICSRNHLKCIYKIENLSENHEANLDQISKSFGSKGIECIKDDPGKTWYDLDPSAGIMIIDKDGHAHPLSHYSRIMSLLGNTKFTRVYVKSEDYEKAKKIIARLGL